MPKIDNTEYENAPVSDGEFKKVTAGGYICRIQAIRTEGDGIDYVKDKQYVKVIWDIDEGDLAGYFSDDYWAGEDKDWGHTAYLSWKNIGVLKNWLTCLDESNPGFDAKAAFDADKWELFIGKRIGFVFGEEEYLGNDGNVKTRLRLPNVKSVQDIQNGKFRVPALKQLENTPESTTTTSAAVADAYDDVPF